MEDYVLDENSGDQNDDDDSPEKAFMEGFEKDEKIEECAECGSAINEEKKVTKEIDGETHNFCSKLCAEEFEENL